MKPIKKDSLHLRLYEVYGQGEMQDLNRRQLNFCQYSRGVMFGGICCLGVVLAGVFIGSAVLLQGVGSLLLWMVTDNPWLWFLGGAYGEATTITLFICLGIAAIVAACVSGMVTRVKWKEAHPVDETVEHEPGFIVTWYRAWKEKYCPLVTMEQDETS